MTDEYERGHAAGREAGIREAAALFGSFGMGRPGIERAILAILDAPAPAGVTAQEVMRDGIVKGMHIALTTPIEEVPEAIAAATRALSGDRT